MDHAAAIDPPQPKRPSIGNRGVVGWVEVGSSARDGQSQLDFIRYVASQGFDIGCFNVDHGRDCHCAARWNVDGSEAVARIVGGTADAVPAGRNMQCLRGGWHFFIELDDAEDGRHILVGDGDVVCAAQHIANFIAQTSAGASRGFRNFEVR